MKVLKNKMNKGLFALCIFGIVTAATLCSCSKTVEEMYKNDQINQPSSGVIFQPITQDCLKRGFIGQLNKIGDVCSRISKILSSRISQLEMMPAQALAVKDRVESFFNDTYPVSIVLGDVINFLELAKNCLDILSGYGYNMGCYLTLLTQLQGYKTGHDSLNSRCISELLLELGCIGVIFEKFENIVSVKYSNVDNRCSTSAQTAQVGRTLSDNVSKECSSILTEQNGWKEGSFTSVQTEQIGRTLDDRVNIPAEAWEAVKDKIKASLPEEYKKNLLRAALDDWNRQSGARSRWKQVTAKYGIRNSHAYSQVSLWKRNGSWDKILDCLEKYPALSWIRAKRSCIVQEKENMFNKYYGK